MEKVYRFPFLHTFNKVQKINATTFQDPSVQAHKIFIPHRADFNMIHLFTHGYGNHSVDFNKVEAQPGYILFIAQGQIQQFDPRETYDAKTLIFTDDFFCRNAFHRQFFTKTPLFNNPLQVSYFYTGQRFEELKKLFEYITDELKRPVREQQGILLHNYLFNIMLIAETIYEPGEQITASLKNRHLLADFKELANRHIYENWSVEEYAKKLNVTPRTLQMAFVKIEGTSPKNWLQGRCLLEIKRKLAYENLTVKEIAHSLGFKEATNFAKFFKTKTGLSPSEFRQSIHSLNY